MRGREIGMIFQEPMTSLNPVLTVGRQLTEPPEIHLGMTPAAVARPGHRAARHGRHLGSGAAPAAVSAPVQRRDAAADDDRHGAGLQPRAHPGRRAHHRARRDHPGPDPRAHEGPVAEAGRGDGHDHAQPRGGRPLRRPGQRDVRGQDRGARDRARRSTPIRAIPTPSACCARCRASTSRGGPSSCPSRASRPTSRACPPAAPSSRAASTPSSAASREAPPLEPVAAGHVSACWVAGRARSRRRRRERGRARPRRSGPRGAGRGRRDPRRPQPRRSTSRSAAASSAAGAAW